MPHIARVAFSAIASCSLIAAQGQTWTVDDDGPADFADLQPAVDAASNDDVILVRAGDYSPFTIDGKGISLLGDELALVRVLGVPNVVTNVAAGQRAMVRGLTFVAPQNVDAELLRIEANTGSVWLEQIITLPAELWPFLYNLSVADCIEVTDSASVTLLDSDVQGAWGAVPGQGFEPGCRALRVETSTVYVHGTRLRSGMTTVTGGAGVPGFEAVSGTTVLRDVDVEGAAGGAGLAFGGPPPGMGGPGLRLEAGATVWSIGSNIVGGPGGTDGLGGFGPPGNPVQDLGGALNSSDSEPTSLTTTRVVREDNNAILAVSTTPNSSLALLAALDSTPIFVPGLPGFLGVGAFPIIVPIGTADGSGAFALPVLFGNLPLGIATFDLAVQVGAITPTPRFTLSNPSIITVVEDTL